MLNPMFIHKIKKQIKINAATVALLLGTHCIRCPVPKNEGANGNQHGNGRIVTANVLHTVPPLLKKTQKQMAINAATVALPPRTCSIRCPVPKKCRRKLQSMPQRSHCHRERAPCDAPPEKKKSQMTIKAATVAL